MTHKSRPSHQATTAVASARSQNLTPQTLSRNNAGSGLPLMDAQIMHHGFEPTALAKRFEIRFRRASVSSCMRKAKCQSLSLTATSPERPRRRLDCCCAETALGSSMMTLTIGYGLARDSSSVDPGASEIDLTGKRTLCSHP